MVLSRRELPPQSSFFVPHQQAYAGVQFLFQMLGNFTAQAEELVANAGDDPVARADAETFGALERQALSEATQIMCAVTVEGGVNLLCVLVLGEEKFRDEFTVKGRELGVLTKLKRVVPLVTGRSLDESEDIIATAARLAEARNAFVHPKPSENPGSIPSLRKASFHAAREAVGDVQRFFAAAGELDTQYRGFFYLFPPSAS